MKRKQTPGAFDNHMRRIALDTLKYSDTGARIMGGMTKDEARTWLKSKGLYTRSVAKLDAECSGIMTMPDGTTCEVSKDGTVTWTEH